MIGSALVVLFRGASGLAPGFDVGAWFLFVLSAVAGEDVAQFLFFSPIQFLLSFVGNAYLVILNAYANIYRTAPLDLRVLYIQ